MDIVRVSFVHGAVEAIHRHRRQVIVVLLAVHLWLLGYGAVIHSPTVDELGHLPAGYSHWKFFRFEQYAVNPPLVRMIATLPLLLLDPQFDWRLYDDAIGSRSEFAIGTDLLERNPRTLFRLILIARCACIPMSLLGAIICYKWAGELYGPLAGLTGLCLWCFSPNIIAHGQLITPAVGATVFGLCAIYAFWHWVKDGGWDRSLFAGLCLGIALLTKVTWLILVPLYAVLWVGWKICRAQTSANQCPAFWQMIAMFVVAVAVLNAGYLFEGTCQSLETFEFASSALSGNIDDNGMYHNRGNRFRNTWFGHIYVPLPSSYLLGIDHQQVEFERKRWSYLGGEWRLGGWWYFYLYALAIKVPLGTWCLFCLALVASAIGSGFNSTLRNEIIVLAPAVAILIAASVQTGYSHHLRYVLPIFPLAFIWMSKVARIVQPSACVLRTGHKITTQTSRVVGKSVAGLLVIGALTWTVTSSLLVYPHSLSYFNEIVGGPIGGHFHLGGTLYSSNIDWGQDLFLLKRWCDRHHEVHPIGVALSGGVDPRLVGIPGERIPPGPNASSGRSWISSERVGPIPGWYAVSVNELHSLQKEYDYFLHFDPFAMVGYSIYIYHITADDANSVRTRIGLPALTGD